MTLAGSSYECRHGMGYYRFSSSRDDFQRNLSTGEVEIESYLGYEINGLKPPPLP